MSEPLWTCAGSYPGPLPAIAYGPDGLSYTNLANSEAARVITGWTQAPAKPAFDPASEHLAWDGAAWTVEPGAETPPTPAAPIRIKKFWLFERFNEDQEKAYAKLEYQARNLTPAQLDDPANEALFQIQRFDRRLGAIEFVELDSPLTLAFFELLRQQGVFGDPQDQASHDALIPILAEPQPHEVI